MSDLELSRLGLFKDSTVFKSDRYWCNVTQTHIVLDKDTTPERVMEIIYDQGMQAGVEQGKAQRSKEFRYLINNNEI
jgi:hypothetical protein